MTETSREILLATTLKDCAYYYEHARALRTAAGISVRNLAKVCGVHKNSVIRWELKQAVPRVVNAVYATHYLRIKGAAIPHAGGMTVGDIFDKMPLIRQDPITLLKYQISRGATNCYRKNGINPLLNVALHFEKVFDPADLRTTPVIPRMRKSKPAMELVLDEEYA